MRRIIAGGLSLMLLSVAQGQDKSPESKVFNQWVGTWKTEFINKPAEWNPTEKRMAGNITCKWILGGKFVEEVGSSLGQGIEHRVLWGYDSQKKTYRYWFFDSTGTIGEGLGTWDEKTSTMTWKTDPGSGLVGTATHRFLNPDSYEWTYVIRDTQGKLYLDYQGKHKRVK